MKKCKKYLFPIVALMLSLMMLFTLPAVAADEQETTKVVAQPADPEIITPETGDSIDDILGGLFGESDPDSEGSQVGEDIRDFADEAGGVLKVFDQILQNIRDLFGNLLNMLLTGLGGLSGGLGGGLDNLF